MRDILYNYTYLDLEKMRFRENLKEMLHSNSESVYKFLLIQSTIIPILTSILWGHTRQYLETQLTIAMSTLNEYNRTGTYSATQMAIVKHYGKRLRSLGRNDAEDTKTHYDYEAELDLLMDSTSGTDPEVEHNENNGKYYMDGKWH